MKKILVIDDEEWLREMVHLALSQKGYEVIEAENGAVGIEVARKDLPDLILCDVNMEKVDGYLTLSSLRSEPVTASIPFILMTGLADNAGMRHGMELGADDYLPKPFTIEALYAAVEARFKKATAIRQEAEKKLADLRDNISMMLPHEMRTPLNGILAYGEILATEAATLPPEEVAEMGQIIHDSGKRLERSIENFLIYSQIELLGADPAKGQRLAPQTDGVSRCGDRAARASPGAGLAHRPADLKLDLADKAAPISEEYLGKIVDELVQNAFKFSSAGTRVGVTLAESPARPRPDRLRSGPRLLDRANPKGRRLHAIRPQDAGATGAGPRFDHRQTPDRTARRYARHSKRTWHDHDRNGETADRRGEISPTWAAAGIAASARAPQTRRPGKRARFPEWERNPPSLRAGEASSAAAADCARSS